MTIILDDEIRRAICCGPRCIRPEDCLKGRERFAAMHRVDAVKALLAAAPSPDQHHDIRAQVIEECARVAANFASQVVTPSSERTCQDIAHAIRFLDQQPDIRAQVTDEMIEAAADIIERTPLIDAPKLPAEYWHGLARAILQAAFAAKST